MSATRKRYIRSLVARIIVFMVGLYMYKDTQNFEILDGNNFFKDFHVLHILWGVWILDMILQIIPLKNKLALGSQKLFANRFKPIIEKINYEELKNYVITTTKAAYKVFVIWTLVVVGIGALYYFGVINKITVFMITVFFYVCDLICVLIWCPFRLLMKNKCCTTCRIFNWDHLMMFAPLIFIGGFFSTSLVIMAIIAWLVWEVAVMIYPERFSEMTNEALKCSSCTDKLCTQYCQKKRNKKQRNF
ncbi:MAG: hypothetical protein IJN50_04120 [Clostridia bacterium]|nr:hypothetical protein [Clostridia bacterium]